MAHDPACVFCRIATGALPAFKLAEDADTLAFMDINPANSGHCLVIAKAHFPDLYALPAELFAAVANTVSRVAGAVRAELQPDGLNLLQANGQTAGQSVYHFHVHILPRRADDGLHLNWVPKPGDMAEIGRLAARIRARL